MAFLASQFQVWAPPSVGPQKCLLNESPGAVHPSPHPEPFFRVAVKNKERGQEGVSCLSKVYVRLSKTTITLLRGRRTLVSPIFCLTLLGFSLSCRLPRPCHGQLLQPPGPLRDGLQSTPREEVFRIALKG